jgi:DNA-binding CsgD family transcriptional regulator/tetratricopeptide (TPR) repeat protein
VIVASAAVGYEPAAELVSRIYERSEGNPYFNELLASTATASENLPRELRDLLMEPVAALPPAPRRLLEAVCVAGGRIPAAAVAQALNALGAETGAYSGSADMLVGLRLLRLQDGYFAPFHALLGEAVASAVPPEQRRSIHSALAAALEDLAAAGTRDLAGEIAVHAVRGGDSRRGLLWSLRAATEAERLHAYATAQSQFERAAGIWDAVGEEKLENFDLIEVLHRCASCAEGAGEWDAAAGHTRRAVSLAAGDPSRAALLEANMSWYAARLGTPGSSTAFAESAAARLTHDAPPAVRAKVALRLVDAYYFDGNWPALQAQIDEAMRAGEESEDPAVKSRLMAAHAMVLMMNRDPAAEAVASAALSMARSSGDLTDLHMAACGLGTVLDALGRSEEAAEAYLSVVTELQEGGLARGPVSFQLAMAARSLFFLGRWDDTEKLIQRSLALQPSGVAGAHSQVVAMEAAAARGRFEQADCLWEAVQPELAMAPRIYTFMGLEGAAAAAADRGRASEALRLSVEALGLINCTLVSEFGPGRVLWTIARASADVAQSGRATGDDGSSAREAVASAQEVIGLLGRRPFDPSDVPEGWRPEGYGASWEAELARLRRDQGGEVTAWTAAVKAWDRSRAPQFAAYARLRLVDALARASTSRAELVDLLRDAHATADRLDALPLRNWARTAAKRLRINVSAPADANTGVGTAAAVLTKRERQVLDLMAAGRSNREIATGLFISEKTVSTHISNILRKLQVTNRHDASSLILHQPPDTRTVN